MGSNPAIPTSGTADDQWVARFRAPRVGLPQWALERPSRCLYAGNPTGTFELYAWDRDTDRHRQVTDRSNGTGTGVLHPSGEEIWWFADTDGDEFGVWMRQPFGGGADLPASPALAPSYPAGLGLGHTVAVVGRSTDEGTTVSLVGPDGEPATLYASEHDASVAALSRDESLICIEHSEHGDSRHPALRVLRPDGTVVADLWDGAGKGLSAVAFSPVSGDARLLVVHEREGRPMPLVWDPTSGTEQRVHLDLAGDLAADWYADGTGLLVHQEAAARSALHRYDLVTGELTPLETPAGTISSATARPNGAVEFVWSSSASPPAVRDLTGRTVLAPPGAPAPPSVPAEDSFVSGPGGVVHALVCRPAGDQPYPTVFHVHGGPAWADHDAFAPDRAAWVDRGYAVVHVNYRGSTGYGSAWRDAIEGRPGLTELEDLAAVREWAVVTGLADPDRVVLTGGSWGGYLTLLGLGVQAQLWSLGIAAVPVADYVAAYEDEMEPLRAFDRSLFGGSPSELPDLYRQCSPISYVADVRVPVLVLAGENDPRCPIRQIDNYLQRLRDLGKPFEVYRYDAGHGSLVVEERVRQMGAELDFASRHLGV